MYPVTRSISELVRYRWLLSVPRPNFAFVRAFCAVVILCVVFPSGLIR